MFLQMTTAIAIEDVRREVKILRALTGHKNLVQFYDACEDDDNVYVVMEYVQISQSFSVDILWCWIWMPLALFFLLFPTCNTLYKLKIKKKKPQISCQLHPFT